MAEPKVRKPTRQQEAVLAALIAHPQFRSAQDWHALLRASGDGVGLATVYRTLQSLADTGRADVVRTEDGESVYRACSTRHHHHLVCRGCGRTEEVDGPAVEAWAAAVGASHHFTEVRHTIEISGYCPACAGPAPGGPAPGPAP